MEYRKRKCVRCKQELDAKSFVDGTSKDIIMDVTKSGRKFYHIDCFKDYKLNHSRPKWTEEEYNQRIVKMSEETKKYLQHQLYFEKLNMFIQDNYPDIAIIPVSFFESIQEVERGTYKNVTRKIPVEDIYDMWTQKINWLHKTHNKRRIKENEGVVLFYDLAILCGKYGRYLEWKAKEAGSNVELIKEAVRNKNTDTTNLIQISINNHNQKINNESKDNDDIIDIDSISEEI